MLTQRHVEGRPERKRALIHKTKMNCNSTKELLNIIILDALALMKEGQ